MYPMSSEQPQHLEPATGEEAPSPGETPAPAKQNEAPVAKEPPVSKWKLRARKLVWPLHARFPSVVPNPYGDNRAYYRERDTQDNIETRIDENVSLKLGCIMVSEIFGPNEVENLYDGLEKLGWDKERVPIFDRSNIDWLKTQRLYGTEGRMPLGWVHRPEDVKKFVGVRYTAEYPKEFSSLLVTISQLTPSVTCLSVGFILSDEASLGYANEINRPAQTTYVPRRRSRAYSIKGVEHVKEERTRRVRKKYRELGISWLSKNFPGFFSEHCERRHLPTAEFLMLEGFTPFDKESDKGRTRKHWPRFVNLDRDFDSWRCTSVPSLAFSFHSGRRDETPNHMIVGLRWDTLSKDDTKFYGSDSLSSRVYFANERLDGIIARYALASYLRELLRSLKQTRQSLSMRSRERRSISAVKQISTFFRRSVGVPSIAREVLALSEDDASFRWNVSGFAQQIRSDKDETFEIKEGLKSFLGRLSRQLLEEDQDTREFLNQLSSAMGTKESIAAQRRMEWVAVLALIVAAISMFVQF